MGIAEPTLETIYTGPLPIGRPREKITRCRRCGRWFGRDCRPKDAGLVCTDCIALMERRPAAKRRVNRRRRQRRPVRDALNAPNTLRLGRAAGPEALPAPKNSYELEKFARINRYHQDVKAGRPIRFVAVGSHLT